MTCQVNFHLYHYAGNNPVKYTDPDGKFLEVSDNGDGTYTITGGSVNSDKNIYIMNNGERGAVLGQMLTENSFFDEDALVCGALIDMNDTSGKDFLSDLKKDSPSLLSYMINARNGEKYDFKDFRHESLTGEKLNQYRHRGMSINIDSEEGKIFASARDIGNYAAGFVAAKSGLSWKMARFGFDGYQSIKSGRFCSEGSATQLAQKAGFTDGKKY